MLFNSTHVDYHDFKECISYLESSHNYRAVNQFGMLGKYQFDIRTLDELYRRKFINFKIKKGKEKIFINSPHLQEMAMDALIALNYIRYHNECMEEYVSPYVFLSAAHLLGYRKARDFFKGNISYVPKDGNNTSVTKYINYVKKNLFLKDERIQKCRY